MRKIDNVFFGLRGTEALEATQMKLKLKARFNRSDARTTTDYVFHRSLRTQRNEGCGTSRGEESAFWVEVAVSKGDGHIETRKYREKNWYARRPVRPPR